MDVFGRLFEILSSFYLSFLFFFGLGGTTRRISEGYDAIVVGWVLECMRFFFGITKNKSLQSNTNSPRFSSLFHVFVLTFCFQSWVSLKVQPS